MKQLFAFAFALSIIGQSLDCLTICADHAEQSTCASEESGFALIEQEDGRCLLDTLRFLQLGRTQKTSAGQVMQPLPHLAILGVYHPQSPSLIGAAPQPASTPHLQGIPALRI